MRTDHIYHLLTGYTQLVASADCAGALDVTDDLQNLLVYIFARIKLF